MLQPSPFIDLAPVWLIIALIIHSLLSFLFIFYLRLKSRKSNHLEKVNSLWTVRLLLVSFIILWALIELLRLPYLRQKALTLTPHQELNLCRTHVVLSLGFLEPGFLVLLLFLLNVSIKKRTPRGSWALAFLLATCLPVFLLQFLFVFFRKYEESLPKFLLQTSRFSDGEAVLCSYPLLSTILFGAFVTIYCFYFLFSCWTVLSIVINKTLRTRIYWLAVTVVSTLALQVSLMALSALWLPEKPEFGLLELMIFLTMFTCAAVGEGIFIIIPIRDSLSVSKDCFCSTVSSPGDMTPATMVEIVSRGG